MTPVRKIPPAEWADKFKEVFKPDPGSYREKQKLPENNFCIPGLFKQSKIFFIRDLLSKIADKQYVLISLLGAPLLAFLLAFFTRSVKEGEYIFSENENIPAYLFMCVITSLFLGLIISAEEIVKDRKILKRESFLNLSWFSYLNSKIMIVFTISAIQTLSFILIGNGILGIKGMTFSYWLLLFTTSCSANLLGLNISAAFNSVITIYIIIPFILIPQLLFSGVLVKYDNLNRSALSSYEYVPVIGDLMPARWSFEAITVEQFKRNKYERPIFKFDMEESNNDYNARILISALTTKLDECNSYVKDPAYLEIAEKDFRLLNFHIKDLSEVSGIALPDDYINVNYRHYNEFVRDSMKVYFAKLRTFFRSKANEAVGQRQIVVNSIRSEIGIEGYIKLQDDYKNKWLEDIVKNRNNPPDLYESDTRLIRKTQPVFMLPDSKYGRAHFYAPFKQIGNILIDTYWFNILVLWLVSVVLYLILYFKLLPKAANLISDIRFRKQDI